MTVYLTFGFAVLGSCIFLVGVMTGWAMSTIRYNRAVARQAYDVVERFRRLSKDDA